MVFFRSRHLELSDRQKSHLRDLASICDFIGTSDPPAWLRPDERTALARYLEARPDVRRLDRYRFAIAGREVDFSPVVLDDPDAVRVGLAPVSN